MRQPRPSTRQEGAPQDGPPGTSDAAPDAVGSPEASARQAQQQTTQKRPERADLKPRAEAPTAATQKERGPKLLETGVSGLDAQFGGGIPAGNTVLVLSDPLDAPSLFAQQYAAQGLRDGERVFYITVDRPEVEVRRNVARLAGSEAAASRMDVFDGFSLNFKGMPRSTRQRLHVEADIDPMELLEGLLEDETLRPPFRIVIDSITDLAVHYESDRIFKMLRLLHAMVRALDGSCLVLMVDPLHDREQVAAAQHLADGVIHFRLERHGAGGIVPFLMVSKMRGIVDPQRMLRFKETETGLWLESTQRVQ